MERILIQWMEHRRLFEPRLIPIITQFLLGCSDHGCDCRLIYHASDYKVQIQPKKTVTIAAEPLNMSCTDPEKATNYAHFRIVESSNAHLEMHTGGYQTIMRTDTIEAIPHHYHLQFRAAPIDTNQPAQVMVEYQELHTDHYEKTLWLWINDCLYLYSNAGMVPRFVGPPRQEKWDRLYPYRKAFNFTTRITEAVPQEWG